MESQRPLAVEILLALAEVPLPGIISMPRLTKRLGVGASMLLRILSQMGDAEIAGQKGPGWVRVEQTEDRWLLQLTPAGHEVVASLKNAPPADEGPAQV